MLRQLEALEIGNSLLKQHNLDNVWKIEFNKSPTKLGACWHDSKVIAISVHMLNSTEKQQFIDTFLHEIAHALVGPGHGHDDVWKEKALEIGSTATITGPMQINLPSEEKKPRKNLIEKHCPTCGKVAIETSRATFSDKISLKLECGHLVEKSLLHKDVFDFNSWTSLSGKKLYPYQVQGAEFILNAQGRVLIADEPALGKTVQAISFLKAYPASLPCLWICKTTLKIQALKEQYDWAEFTPQIIEKSGFYPLPNMGIYIVSYDLLRRIKKEKLEALGIKTIVFDEVQHIKNPDSTRTQEVRRLVNNVDFFIALSGTPWKNRGSEYFSVLNMLAPEKFPSYKHFKNRWVDVVWDAKALKYREGGIRDIKAFREYTKDFVIRRMRDDVLPDLPKIKREVRYVELEDIYGEAYEKAESKVAAIIKDLILDGNEARMTMLLASELMKLKHITGLAKVDAQVEDAIEFLEDTEDWQKLTIFHHHIDVGDGVENKLNTWLSANGYGPALRLKGGVDAFTRADIIEKFKQDEKSRILIASTLASGEGLNIQFCQNASMLERQWNPANEEQAELRFSRPLNYNEYPEYLQNALFNDDKEPKKISIRVPYVICANTIDELLTHLVEHKRVNFRKSMNEGEEELQFSESEMVKDLADAIIKKRYGKK